jgi:predicted nuclease with TOPRIM domain
MSEEKDSYEHAKAVQDLLRKAVKQKKRKQYWRSEAAYWRKEADDWKEALELLKKQVEIGRPSEDVEELQDEVADLREENKRLSDQVYALKTNLKAMADAEVEHRVRVLVEQERQRWREVRKKDVEAIAHLTRMIKGEDGIGLGGPAMIMKSMDPIKFVDINGTTEDEVDVCPV